MATQPSQPSTSAPLVREDVRREVLAEVAASLREDPWCFGGAWRAAAAHVESLADRP